MSPGVYDRLKKEPLWSPEVQAAVKKGLQDAIDEKIVAKEAHRSLSQMLAAEQNWSEAILHFNKALSYQREISAGDYIQLGRLYLYNDMPEESIVSFYKALTISPDKENSFAAITRIFDNRSHQHEFSLFYSDIEKNFLLSPEMQIIAAKKFIDLKQLDKARRVLTAVNDYRPNGDCVLLAGPNRRNRKRLGCNGDQYPEGHRARAGERALPQCFYAAAQATGQR